MPKFVKGISLKDELYGNGTIDEPSVAYWTKARTIRTKSYRLVLHDDGFAELYDHMADGSETNNIAEERPNVVRELTELLNSKLPQ